jgi:hypothetical protein
MSGKFSYLVTATRDLKTFDPETYFKIYDHYEKYDAHKNYCDVMFAYDYGYGLRNYEYHLCTIEDKFSDNVVQYVGSNEVFNSEQLNKLKPYCQCDYHKMYWFNPIKYVTPPDCVGCLDTKFYGQYVIKRTRDYVNANNINL